MTTGHLRTLLSGSRIMAGAPLVGAALVVIFCGIGGGSAAADDRKASGDVVARGLIEPLSRVIAVSAPVDGGVAVLRRLLVDRGDQVQADQVLAYLDGYDLRKSELALAERNLEVAQLQRVQVLAGAKKSDIAAQENVVAARRAQLARFEADLDRNTKLYRHAFASKQALEALQAQYDDARNQVEQARNTLKALTEVRSIDDRVASTQIDVQKATVERARAAMEREVIRAPIAGTILSIQARAGEAVSADGVLRLADLSHLIVIAEVDESQIGQIALGEKAKIVGAIAPLPKPVPAHVTRIAHEVFREKRPASDILIGRDARIVEVELTPEAALPSVMGGEVAVHFNAAAAIQTARP